MTKILMVCLGNICRSPLAEGIMRKKLQNSNIEGMVDSCGFEAFHTGDAPDQRSIEIARQHGVDISMQQARSFTIDDFDRFDKIYVMDQNNYIDVTSYARSKEDLNKIDFIMNAVYPGSNRPIPDPYYGGKSGFKNVWEMLDEASDKIIEQIKTKKIGSNGS